MCNGLYQTSQNEIENTRLLLQISYERCNQLVNTNNQLFGIIAAICIGLITFLGTAYFTSTDPNRYYVIILAIQVICFTLLAWRFYAHIIDNDIVSAYKKILDCENKLNVNLELSLIQSLGKIMKIDDNPLYANKPLEEKYRIIRNLINRNKGGYRYHDILDHLGTGLISIAFVIQFAIFCRPPIQLQFFEYLTFLIIIPSVYCVIFFYFLEKDSVCIVPIQRDPSDNDLLSVFSEFVIPLKKF